MASGVSWNDVFCPDCGKQVEILNRDLQLSMELHKQSHKPLEIINQAYNMDNISNPLLQSVQLSLTDISYHGNKENMCLKNNAQQQIIKDSLFSSVIQSVESPPTSSTIPIQSFFSKQINLLSDVFSLLPSDLKPHQGFITENEKGELYCKICNVSIDCIRRRIKKHLKTRLHEDRTIKYFKDTLSNELHHIMEFVLFNNSKLCCNLCRFSFSLCPDNPDETIFSIMKHNLSKEHLERTTKNGPKYNSNEAYKIVNSFSQLNQVINNNQHLLEFKTHSEFVCKLCKVVVGCNVNETSLYKLFIEHFMSQEHLNCKAAYEGESCNIININANNYTMSLDFAQAGSFLTCTENIQQAANSLKPSDDHSILPGNESQKNHSKKPGCAPVSQQRNITLRRNLKLKKTETIQSILRSLSQEIENSQCVVPNGQGKLMCSICNLKLPLRIEVVKAHLLGKSHRRRYGKFSKIEIKSIEKINSTTNNFKSSDDLNALLGSNLQEDQSGNPLVSIPQQLNITQHVDEPNVKESVCHVKPSNRNEVLNSKGAPELKAYNALNISAKPTHHFVMSSHSIYCSVCKCYIPPNDKALTRHIKQITSNEIPPTTSSVGSAQADRLLASIEKTQPIANEFKISKDINISKGRYSQENNLQYLENCVILILLLLWFWFQSSVQQS